MLGRGQPVHRHAGHRGPAEACGDGGGSQGLVVARFLASTFDGEASPFDVFEPRAVDAPVSDDMLACLNALCWGQTELYSLALDGGTRVLAAQKGWGHGCGVSARGG